MYMENPSVLLLCMTISLLWISVAFILGFSDRTPVDYGLAGLLVATIFSSYWFWSCPQRNSLAHYIDAFVAKLCIGSFIFYTLFVKDELIELKLLYGIVLAYIGLSFWFSNLESQQRWCSPDHIRSHAFLHFWCFVATFFQSANLRLSP
jgi:hypothetical protein